MGSLLLAGQKRALRLLVRREAFQALLHRSDEAEHEHRHGCSGHRQQTACAMSPEALEDIGQE